MFLQVIAARHCKRYETYVTVSGMRHTSTFAFVIFLIQINHMKRNYKIYCLLYLATIAYSGRRTCLTIFGAMIVHKFAGRVLQVNPYLS